MLSNNYANEKYFLGSRIPFFGIVVDLFICGFLIIVTGFYLYALRAIYSCP